MAVVWYAAVWLRCGVVCRGMVVVCLLCGFGVVYVSACVCGFDEVRFVGFNSPRGYLEESKPGLESGHGDLRALRKTGVCVCVRVRASVSAFGACVCACACECVWCVRVRGWCSTAELWRGPRSLLLLSVSTQPRQPMPPARTRTYTQTCIHTCAHTHAFINATCVHGGGKCGL